MTDDTIAPDRTRWVQGILILMCLLSLIGIALLRSQVKQTERRTNQLYAAQAQARTAIQQAAVGKNFAQSVSDACDSADRTKLAQLGVPCAQASSVAAQPAPTAVAGPQGQQGAPGINGVNGLNGRNGLNGATGATGATGPRGAQGAAGPSGATGATGPQGATGAVGPQGSAGPAGPAGANGSNGADGQPPYSWTYSIGPRDFTCTRSDPFDASKPTYTCATL